MMEKKTLAFEIGCEEIPAFDLKSATDQLKKCMQDALVDIRLEHGDVEVYSTPRRLIAVVQDVATSTEAVNERIKGPSKKIAFDADGNPTKAASGFARGKGVAVEDLEVAFDGDEEYVFALKSLPSLESKELLPQVLKGIIESLSWPKSMRWSTHKELFSRPIRWICAMHGNDVIPLEFAGINSSNKTYGHRFLAKGPFEVSSADKLLDVVEASYVVATQEGRKDIIKKGIDEIVSECGQDYVAEIPEKTLTEVINLTEYPTPLKGVFDKEFLKVPEEIIVDAMLMHQRYFPIYKDGLLTNNFIIVSNGDPAFADEITKGNERVVAARLYDAKFFYEEDLKTPLDEYVDRLDEVVFQEKLGTMKSKTSRICRLSERICLDASITDEEKGYVARAAYLAKADLVTNAVIEFTSVQGIMGSYYADAQGESKRVSRAIADHYRPRFSGDEPADDVVGKIVALSDKLDTICGLFAIGQGPTGSSDPFALRRAAIGIISILKSGLDVSLEAAIKDSLRIYLEDGIQFNETEVMSAILDFFVTRTKVMLHEDGMPVDTIDAVLTIGVVEPLDIIARCTALQNAMTNSPDDFNDLAIAYSRANNLRDKNLGTDVDAALFTNAEKELSYAIETAETKINQALEVADYDRALLGLAGLRTPIDNFFEAVMVMDDDKDIRENRLKLLNRFIESFARVADFGYLA